MPDLHEYESDVLFLPIGANPLPNYVAARLLTRRNARVIMLHTGGPSPRSTLAPAERLGSLLGTHRPDLRCELREIDHVDGYAIETTVGDIASRLPYNTHVGLHYTGGTKPMAVHATLAVRAAFPNAVFSYLDPTALALMVRVGAGQSRAVVVSDGINDLTLPELFELHGYTVQQGDVQADYVDLAQALSRVHVELEGGTAWLRYVRDSELASLPTVVDYPELAPVVEVFSDWGGTPEAVANHMRFERLPQCTKWFAGSWLEVYAYECLSRFADRLGCTSLGLNYVLQKQAGPRAPEIDIAALVGYQLFGISCAASRNADRRTASCARRRGSRRSHRA